MKFPPRSSFLAAALSIAVGCATAPPRPPRDQRGAAERSAALRASDPVAAQETNEERFATEQARARAEEKRRRQREEGERVEVLGPNEKVKRPKK